ncbi:hypothetical protein CR513_55556, partial [Mucuna pruriens]
MDRSMIDTASGGALLDKTPAIARHLISNMASNMQQFETRGTIAPRMVNEVVEHPIDMCPTLQEIELDHPENVGPIGPAKLSPPLEAQAESLSARLKIRLVQPKAQSGSLAQVTLHVSNTRATSAPAQAPHHLLELGTKKPKVTRGDRLEHQRTLADLILSVLASRGEPPPSITAIVVNGGTTKARA